MTEQHTYNEWLDKGYQVMFGEKATGRNKQGHATFSRKQVEEVYDEPGEEEWDMEYDQFVNYDRYFDGIGDR